MSTQTDPNAFLLGGGGRSASLHDVGDKIDGVITAMEMRQQTDLKTRMPKTWDNGDPMMQLVITLSTDLREDTEDDGARNFYAKGGTKNEQSSQGAVAKAVKDAGAPGLEIGGRLQVAIVGFGTSGGPGLNAPKQHVAKYTRPVMPVGGNDPFGDSPAPAAAAPADPFGSTSAPPLAAAEPANPFSDF